MEIVFNCRIILYFTTAVCLAAADPAFFPLKDLRPGMHATGRTVFAGDNVEDFQVEILGVLENSGPKQSIILARLSGGPLEKTGVMQGMSGSPVYIDGRLVGAVAMAFPFSKEPIAGIRPIEEMVTEQSGGDGKARAGFSLSGDNLMASFPKRDSRGTFDSKLIDIATPVSFSGFSAGTLEHFRPATALVGAGAPAGRFRRCIRRRETGERTAAAGVHDLRSIGIRGPEHRRGRNGDAHRWKPDLGVRSSLPVGRKHGTAVRPRLRDYAVGESIVLV